MKVNLPFNTPVQMIKDYRFVKSVDRGNRYLNNLRTRNPYRYSELGFTPPKKPSQISKIRDGVVKFLKDNFAFWA